MKFNKKIIYSRMISTSGHCLASTILIYPHIFKSTCETFIFSYFDINNKSYIKNTLNASE